MYLTVGEISKALGISTEAIRYYVKEGIITPKRNEENNYWVYSSDDLMKLTDIMFYRSMRLTMKDIEDIMSGLALSEKILKTRKMSMLGTWSLGIIVCVDDYLNCLAVSAAVRKITDNEKVSREMLAYIINSTGVTVCAIIPFSSWAAFMGGLMEKSDMLGGYSVSGAYIHTIPFMLYGWLAVICVPLFILKVIPLFGPMKKAENRALTTGEVFSPEAKAQLGELPDEELKFKNKKCRAINFLAPILLVAVLTVTTEEPLIGVFAALALCFIMYLPQRLMTAKEYFNNIMAGLQSFASGSFWGLAAIAFPIVGSLSAALGVSPLLCGGARISEVAFGGHICLYSDTVILTSASTQITNAEYFRTSGPLVALPFAIATVGFIVLGFVMA